MPERITNLFFRDEDVARKESEHGFHHTFYLYLVIGKLLKQIGIETYDHTHDAIYSGEHKSLFRDPVTQCEYEIKITPRNRPPIAKTGV